MPIIRRIRTPAERKAVETIKKNKLAIKPGLVLSQCPYTKRFLDSKGKYIQIPESQIKNIKTTSLTSPAGKAILGSQMISYSKKYLQEVTRNILIETSNWQKYALKEILTLESLEINNKKALINNLLKTKMNEKIIIEEIKNYLIKNPEKKEDMLHGFSEELKQKILK